MQTSPRTHTAPFAVLTAANYLAASERLGRPIASVGDLAELAVRFHHRQVLVHPTAHAALELPQVLPERRAHHFAQADPARWRITPADAVLRPFYTLSETFDADRTRATAFVDVYLPGFDREAGLELLGPGRLRAALEHYATALGAPYRFSPGSTGTRLMAQGRKLTPSTLNYPEPALAGSTELDLRVSRPLTLPESGMRYVHAYDARARYLASCSALELGLGEPVELTRQADAAAEHHPPPGYWHAYLAPGPFPDPLGGMAKGQTYRWITTPTLVLATELGRLIGVERAYVWPEKARVLAPFYRRMRAALAYCDEHGREPGVAEARALLKRTYTMGFGWLAGGWLAPGDVLYRPDWRHHIIAASRVNLYRRFNRARAHPFAVDVDSIYLASDDPEPSSGPPLVSDDLGGLRPTGAGSMAAYVERVAAGVAPIAAAREVTA